MPLGSSAGRSSGNRLGEGAVRRATPRERAGIDNPRDPEPTTPRWVLTPRGERAADVAIFLGALVLCGFASVVIAHWFGFI